MGSCSSSSAIPEQQSYSAPPPARYESRPYTPPVRNELAVRPPVSSEPRPYQPPRAQAQSAQQNSTSNSSSETRLATGKRLQEFYTKGGTHQDDQVLKWDPEKGGFVVQNNKGESHARAESFDRENTELVWDAEQKRYVARRRSRANTTSDSSRVLHPGVVCDSCMRSAEILLLSTLVGAFSLEKGCIMGVRYKSATVYNFDLCEMCERLGLIPEAAPYVKIEDPAKAPVDIKLTILAIDLPQLTALPGFAIHFGVRCDGCKVSPDLKAIAMACGRNVDDTLIGTRFKSTITNDFDLCEVCEASGRFDRQHAPYLKIEIPSRVVLMMTAFRNGNAYIVQ